MKKNKLSNSSVDKYIECSLCYKLHYVDGIRPVRTKSALLFGGTLDQALNHLLLTQDLDESRYLFQASWMKINKEKIDYSKSDLDLELIEFVEDGNSKFKNEGDENWRSLLYKGMLFINQYHKDILPKIKEVIAVQEPVSLKNEDGDEIVGALDLIVKWEDGKTYLLDNKSSSVKYEPDSAKLSQQLPLYYYIVKERYKLDGIGYIVLSKKINKNKVKKCKDCGTICETNHKTCNIEIKHEVSNEPRNFFYKRCGGEFDITINPTVDIDIILNQVDEKDEQRVIEKFDEVNYNITNEYFATEHNPKKNKYYQLCPYNTYFEGNPDFYKIEKRKNETSNT